MQGNYAVELSASGQERVAIKQSGVVPKKTGLHRLTATIKRMSGDPKVYLWYQDAGFTDTIFTNISEDYVTITKDLTINELPPRGATLGIGIKAGSSGNIVVESLNFVHIDEVPKPVIMLIDPLKKSYINLSAQANQAYSDETPGEDGQGGWADFGSENIAATSNFLTGEQVIGGIPYNLPTSMTESTVIMLGGGTSKRPSLPISITGIPVNQKLGKIGFLHTLMWPTATKGMTIAEYIIHYSDGTQAVHPIVFKQNIDDWYVPSIDAGVTIAHKYKMPTSGERAVFNTLFTNPHPEKTILSIDMRGESKAILALMGITGETVN
ncbi:hypothetical protein D3C73_985070 [compost metagenome]